ncbi:hypothetical protein [uncultured Rhodoblastus sp.]|uniref:hypothetical protein n=1 Tax=uncultured Rhodoblastus sp. TaxID=543037 RepID=UPI0025D8F00B|nr:hypothetical protein [uncultured Rhodoblastus sp.]
MSIHSRAALALSGLMLAVAPAGAGDVSLDQAAFSTGAKGKVTFKNVQLSDANLSQPEVASLFSGTLTREATGALLERLTAKQLKIPEVEILSENGDRYILHDVVADHIEKGGAQSLAFASLDGVLPDDSGDATLHSGPARFEALSMPGLAASLRGEDLNLPAFRFAHLNWDGGELSLVDKATAAGAPGGNRIRLNAGPAHVDQTFDASGVQLAADANFAGLSVKMPPQSKGGAALTAFGYGEVSGDAHYSGAYDLPAREYKLADYSLDLRKIGKIAFSGALSGLEKSVFTGDKATREQAIQAATVDWAQIDVTNAGLFDKIVAFVSLSQGRSPEQVKTEWRSVVSQAPLLFSGAQAVAATAKAVDRFIAEPKNLTLRFKGKGEPLKVGELLHVADPTALIGRLEVAPAPEPARPANAAKP